MPDLTISRFLGLDGRRQEVSALAGTLSKCINAHLNRGGEVEKRYALEQYAAIPSTIGGTYGLAADGISLYAFGSLTSAQLVMPAGITYQRLAHPTPATAMTALLDWSLFNGQIYAVASYADGSIKHFYNGALVTDQFDGKARGGFEVLGGSNSSTVNGISAITVNGVDVLGGFKTFNSTTLSDFATSIAAQITATTSTPDYTGVGNGSAVVIVSATAGTTINGYVVAVTCTGNVTVGNIAAMAGGQDNPPGDPGTTVLTLGDKEYTVASKNINFSATRDAIHFNQNYAGAGFITPAMHSSGAAQPTALGTFVNPQGSAGQTLLVLCREAVQVWHVEVNDDNNEMIQLLENVGTRAGNANLGWNGLHVFFNHTGVAGITKGDASNAASVTEVGAPINKEMMAYAATLTQGQQDAAVAAIDPADNRLWFAIGNRVYVLSSFPESGVAGWSRYDLGFQITDFAVLNRRLYARSGNTVYLYGGAAGGVFDACPVTVRIAYLDAGKPAGFKNLTGMDMAIAGEITVALGTNSNTQSQITTIGVFTESTFDYPPLPVLARESNIAVEMTHAKTENAIISQFVLHYLIDTSPES